METDLLKNVLVGIAQIRDLRTPATVCGTPKISEMEIILLLIGFKKDIQKYLNQINNSDKFIYCKNKNTCNTCLARTELIQIDPIFDFRINYTFLLNNVILGIEQWEKEQTPTTEKQINARFKVIEMDILEYLEEIENEKRTHVNPVKSGLLDPE